MVSDFCRMIALLTLSMFAVELFDSPALFIRVNRGADQSKIRFIEGATDDPMSIEEMVSVPRANYI